MVTVCFPGRARCGFPRCLLVLASIGVCARFADDATLGAAELARPGEGLIASAEPGWPQWRGPRRDGISDETGLLPVAFVPMLHPRDRAN